MSGVSPFLFHSNFLGYLILAFALHLSFIRAQFHGSLHRITSHRRAQVAGCKFGLAIPGGSSLASSDLEKGGKVGLGFSFPLYMCILGFFLCILWLFVVGLGWDQWCVDIWCI